MLSFGAYHHRDCRNVGHKMLLIFYIFSMGFTRQACAKIFKYHTVHYILAAEIREQTTQGFEI